MQDRNRDLIQSLQQGRLDALLISHQPNISYITKYKSRDSYLLISQKDKIFVTDFRYLQEARQELKGFTIKETNGSVFKLISKTIKDLRLSRVGFEARNFPFAEYEKIKQGLSKNIKFIPTANIVENLRQIKDKAEIDLIKQATEIAGLAFKFAREVVKPGKKETEVALEIEYFIRKNFSCEPSFEIIVAAEENSVFPHHITSERKLKENEIVLIDLGVDFCGYKSDLTRMFFLGKIPSTVRRIYDIILAAQDKAMRSIRPGALINQVDKQARQIIAERGFAKYFGHGLGHGVGLEVHEEPHINSHNRQRLEPGMVFTIEPAIYLPQKFGIRIEDIVLVTEKGCEVISGNIHKSI